jgi:hypothetical protein
MDVTASSPNLPAMTPVSMLEREPWMVIVTELANIHEKLHLHS